jgi:hypothetical protein
MKTFISDIKTRLKNEDYLKIINLAKTYDFSVSYFMLTDDYVQINIYGKTNKWAKFKKDLIFLTKLDIHIELLNWQC